MILKHHIMGYLLRTKAVCVRTEEAIKIFIRSKRARGLSPESIRWYRGILDDFRKANPELPETPDRIDDFLASCQAGDERRHGYYRALRAFYNLIEKRQEYFKNPMRFVEQPRRRPKQPKPLTPDELEQLLAYPHNSMVRAALMFLIDTGARVGELVNLTNADIEQTPYGYTATIMGKTGERTVPISLETYHAIVKVLPFGYSKYTIRRMIARAFTDARIRGSGINLRHSFGSLWEGDELVLQRIMGHSHLSTTRIYRALRIERLAEQHHKYSPLKMVMGSTRRLDGV